MVEEHARRAVHLRDDHTLGAVHDKGTVVGHQRHVAHVDVLLLDVADGAGARVFIHVPDHEAQGHFQRRCEGQAPRHALIFVVLRRFEFVTHELQLGTIGEILDREDGLEDFLEAGGSVVRLLQEPVVGGALDLDQVRHLHRFADTAKGLPDAFPLGKTLTHRLRAPWLGRFLPADKHSQRRDGRGLSLR